MLNISITRSTVKADMGRKQDNSAYPEVAPPGYALLFCDSCGSTYAV